MNRRTLKNESFCPHPLHENQLLSFARLRSLKFPLICALLRAFACFCVRPRLERPRLGTSDIHTLRDRKGTPKNLCNKDFAELSGEFSGVICIKTLVLLGSALK